jgi:hypothetical protein
MNNTVREFCKWAHKQRPNLAREFRGFVNTYANPGMSNDVQRGLIFAYMVPLMRRFAESKGYDTRNWPDKWRAELFPPEALNFIVHNIQKEFFNERA